MSNSHSTAPLFISHGPPDIAISDVPARQFLCALGTRLPRPRAIVVVSAHWETEDVEVLATPHPHTVHDFFGFDPALFEMRYPAPGAPAIADDIAARLAAAGMRVRIERERGLDHGVWTPLACMYPAADVPVTQISICPQHNALFHFRLGRALAGLRHDGVLVLGSGAITHNLRDFRAQRGGGPQAAEVDYVAAFCDWLAARVAAADSDALLGYREAAPDAARCHPTPEHLLPLFVALGAAGVSWRGERLHHSVMYGVIAMDCYQFGAREATLQ